MTFGEKTWVFLKPFLPSLALFLFGIAALEWGGSEGVTSEMLKDVLHGTAALLAIVQIPIYEAEILGFLKSALTDTSIIKKLGHDTQNKIITAALRARYEEKCDPEFLNQLIGILKFSDQSYFLQNEVNVRLIVKKDQTVRETRRDIIITHNGDNKINILKLLNTSTARRVYCGAADTRIITEVQIGILPALADTYDISDCKLCEDAPGSSEPGYEKTSLIDWEQLGDKHEVLKKVDVEPGKGITLRYSEVVTTSRRDRVITFRLRHFSKGIKVIVELVNETEEELTLEGSLFGNGLVGQDLKECIVRDNRAELRTSSWLCPGSGYSVFYVDKP